MRIHKVYVQLNEAKRVQELKWEVSKKTRYSGNPKWDCHAISLAYPPTICNKGKPMFLKPAHIFNAMSFMCLVWIYFCSIAPEQFVLGVTM